MQAALARPLPSTLSAPPCLGLLHARLGLRRAALGLRRLVDRGLQLGLLRELDSRWVTTAVEQLRAIH